MKNWMKTLSVALSVAALTSCGPSKPQMFGIDKTKFEAMSPQQQSAQIHKYNEEQAQKQRAETLFNVLGTAAGAAIGQHKVAGSSSSHCNADHTHCESSSSSASIGFG